jgi:hypothetical protein
VLGVRCAQPPLGAVMFLAQCCHQFLHVVFSVSATKDAL